MVWNLIRDSAFGQIVRLVSKGRIFPYAEEKDASLLEKYVNEEKTRDYARRSEERASSEGSESEDPEKGRDKRVIDWYGPDDPEVSRSLCARMLSLPYSNAAAEP